MIYFALGIVATLCVVFFVKAAYWLDEIGKRIATLEYYGKCNGHGIERLRSELEKLKKAEKERTAE